ncbi:hypothetical protein AVEN_94574-1 [Araneus ventricosus]|uniref:HTH psq-type domain-containing protein n=1 Tax=Araneus ventricosus TaxID=182803 RepID=A0A4Y2IRQ2_ARAVE|nr:hypothetical protein AVEN_94574-1 [Araneus ventricosus]
MATHEKNVLDIDTKMKIIEKKDNLSMKQIIEKLKIGKSQFYEILKKNEITELCLHGNGSTKRKMWNTGNEQFNEIVWEWLVDARSRNLLISEPILQLFSRHYPASSQEVKSAVKIKLGHI